MIGLTFKTGAAEGRREEGIMVPLFFVLLGGVLWMVLMGDELPLVFL